MDGRDSRYRKGWIVLGVSATLMVVAVGYVFAHADLGALRRAIGELSLFWLAVIFVALLTNAFMAALRFQIIAADVGHRINIWQAMAAVSGGSLGGALFFQVAGQLMVRGVLMARSGVPFASIVIMTAYERFVAAIISALLAIGGAYFIFGRVFIDQNTGGSDLIKILLGLILATAAGAVIGYGRAAAQAVAPLISQHLALRVVRMIGLSLLVQLPMMAAYVAAAHALAPEIPIQDLAAAAAIVMFAASIPISLAGWGVREMSAIAAMGAIGMAAEEAFLTAVVTGLGSLLAMALMAAISLRGWRAIAAGPSSARPGTIDFGRALAWVLPLATATLVLFQIYIPVSSGTIVNVNLADPLAILGGALFLLGTIRERRLPQWRNPAVNALIVGATLMFTLSLAIGVMRFGWTEWAWINRFLGWFVLLGFAATGALIVKDAGARGLSILLLTYAAAIAAVAVVDIVLVRIQDLGFTTPLPVVFDGIAGFAQNKNVFGFQLLMALAATLAVVSAPRGLRIGLLAILLTALWYAGSRSAWLTTPVVLAAGLYLKAVSWRTVAIAAGLALAFVVSAFLVPGAAMILTETAPSVTPRLTPELIPSEANTKERMYSIVEGLRMFMQHPLFGAGLGGFRQQMAELGVFGGHGLPLVIHSTPVWMLAEMGLVGALVFGVPFVWMLFAELRRRDPDLGARLLILSLLAFALMALPADMLFQRTFWLMAGAGSALLVMPPRIETTHPPCESTRTA